MKVLRDRKADIGISVNPNRETVLSYFANEEALGFELVSGAVSEHTGLQKTSFWAMYLRTPRHIGCRGWAGSPVNVARVI
jgi:hypothetical protein